MAGLSPFQQMVEEDIDEVFLDLDEFASLHLVEGREISAMMDTDDRLELSGGEKLGVSRSSIRIFARIEDLPPRREEGASLNVDHREYIVDSWSEEMGMASVSLSQARGY